MTTHTKYNSSQGVCVGTALQQQILSYKLDCSVLCVTEQCTAYSLEQTTSAATEYHCTMSAVCRCETILTVSVSQRYRCR